MEKAYLCEILWVELRPSDPTPAQVSRWRIRKTKSPPPFGYCYFQGNLVKKPTEYDVLLKIHRQWKEGRDANEITRYLNSKKLIVAFGCCGEFFEQPRFVQDLFQLPCPFRIGGGGGGKIVLSTHLIFLIGSTVKRRPRA